MNSSEYPCSRDFLCRGPLGMAPQNGHLLLRSVVLALFSRAPSGAGFGHTLPCMTYPAMICLSLTFPRLLSVFYCAQPCDGRSVASSEQCWDLFDLILGSSFIKYFASDSWRRSHRESGVPSIPAVRIRLVL
jgi:hypothetical protein